MMQSEAVTADEKNIKRFKNSCGDTVPAEVSGSVVPQEPLFVCMGHNASGANALYNSMGRPLNNVKSCHVTSSLNHLQCTTQMRLEKLADYVSTRDEKQKQKESFDFTNESITANVALNKVQSSYGSDGLAPSKETPFLPSARDPQNRPGVRYMEDLAIYRDLAPTFVGFASGSYEAPSTMELVKRPPFLAGNCGGLMTVQATAFVSGRGTKEECKREANKGIEIGQRLCVTYPREGWNNHQCGVYHNKTTLVVCDADKAQSEHRLNFDLVKIDPKLVSEEIEFDEMSNEPRKIKARLEFMYDSYMTRPLEIGQCRSGCRQEGQMIDMKYDLVAPNIEDLITFAFGNEAHPQDEDLKFMRMGVDEFQNLDDTQQTSNLDDTQKTGAFDAY